MFEVNEKLIEEIKDYINAQDEENSVIEEVIHEAEAYITVSAGTAWTSNPTKVKLGKLLLKNLCDDIYSCRGTQTTQVFKQSNITRTILVSLSTEEDEKEV